MTKILYFGDSHIRGNNPCSRKDDYPNALKAKFCEITNLIKDKKIDCVLCGGDLFNSPDVSKAIISEYIKIFKQWKVPFLTVIGSHDYLGYQLNTILRSALGVLDAAEIVYILDKERGYRLTDKVTIKGIHHSYNLDLNPKNYFVKKDTNGILIEVVHGMVVDKPFFDEYTLIKDIKTEADVMLCAHYHPGWESQKVNNALFINPGSLGRVENIERVFPPSVVILDVGEQIDYEIIPLKCASPSETIFKNVTKLGSEMSEKILEFMKTLSNRTGDLERQDAKSLVLKIAKEEKVDEKVIEEAINIIDGVMFDESGIRTFN